jgi:hypothetical protein
LPLNCYYLCYSDKSHHLPWHVIVSRSQLLYKAQSTMNDREIQTRQSHNEKSGAQSHCHAISKVSRHPIRCVTRADALSVSLSSTSKELSIRILTLDSLRLWGLATANGGMCLCLRAGRTSNFNQSSGCATIMP